MTNALRSRVSTAHFALAVAHGPKGLIARVPKGGFYTSLLLQDIDTLHHRFDWAVEFDGIDRKTGEGALGNLLSEVNTYGRNAGSQAVPQLISAVARDHMMYGRSVFELYRCQERGEEGPRLAVLPGWSLRRRWRATQQALPTDTSVAWATMPSDVLRKFDVTRQLSCDLSRTYRQLAIVDRTRLGEPELLERAGSSGYDFSAHRRAADEMAARATAAIGWRGRDAFMNRATSGHRTYRDLRFLRTWLTIAFSTLSTLSSTTSSEDVFPKHTFRLALSGVPAIDTVDSKIEALMKGTETLDSIRETVIMPRRHW